MKGPTDINEVQDYATRPTTGSEGVIYADYTTGSLYTWNGTAYVSSTATSDEWNEIMHIGNTFTVLDEENLSATITQNDVTNNPAALIIANTGSGNDITFPNSSFIKNGAIQMGTSVTTGNVATTTETIGTSTQLSESSGDTLFENTSATNDFIHKLGDAAGATEHKTVDSADVTLHSIKSDGEVQAGKLGEAGANEVKNAANTTTVKWNSTGNSYVNGGNTVFGGTVPTGLVDIAGSVGLKVRTIAASTGTIAITDNIIAVDYTTTGTVALDLPSAATAWSAANSVGLVFTVMDIDANASNNAITISRAGADTIIDVAAAQTSTALGTDGGVLRFIPINATTWKVW